MTTQTFEATLEAFAKTRPVFQVFQDFLVLAFTIFRRCPTVLILRNLSARYDTTEISEGFPQLLNALMNEVASRDMKELGNDILGECYETYCPVKTDNNEILSWQDSRAVGSHMVASPDVIAKHWSIPILDVGCRSGRLLLASPALTDIRYRYFGIEYNMDFVMITALNLMFNFRANAEVLLVDRDTKAFKESYRISILPHGISQCTDPAQSAAWKTYQGYLSKKENQGS
jgi:hypothetical protein